MEERWDAEHIGIPEYRFPRSNHVYTCHQRIGLREYIPDRTTLARFANTVDHKDPEAVVGAFCLFVDGHDISEYSEPILRTHVRWR